ncbi:HNH endonuclease [Vogesella indigofera]|nr:HNH endonuclease [Vogesella indigofera]
MKHRRDQTVILTLTAAIERVFGTRDEDGAYPLGAFYTRNVSKKTWRHVKGIWYVPKNPDNFSQRVVDLEAVDHFSRAILSGETVLLGTTTVDWEAIPEDSAGLLPPRLADDISADEGARQLRWHMRRERKKGLRNAKIAAVLGAGGTIACEVCGFDFARHYGEPGEGFCEVHHTKPLRDRTGSEQTSIADLAILCSNCHSTIHRTSPMWDVSKLASVWATRHAET